MFYAPDQPAAHVTGSLTGKHGGNRIFGLLGQADQGDGRVSPARALQDILPSVPTQPESKDMIIGPVHARKPPDRH
jgi:hypothetical protein